ncbi:rhamnogalacturonan lyase family protein [Wenyingzhuangia sp. IMCC45467]
MEDKQPVSINLYKKRECHFVKDNLYIFYFFIFSITLFSQNPPRQMEDLDRGLLAVRRNSNEVLLSWRILASEFEIASYNIYKGPTLLNTIPNNGSSNYVDITTSNDTYRVAAVINGIEQELSKPVEPWNNIYKKIPLNSKPEGGTTPDGFEYTYSANDASVADLDGDGEYEIILKWDPSNSKQPGVGFTGNQILQGLKLDGTVLWTIDLGINIKSGPHYTQFLVYDLDGDGKAEIACKTADGTIDGAGTVLGDPNTDYRSSDGRVLTGPEYFSVFDGKTGEFIVTDDYIPARGNVADWGDSYGNRVDRFLACIAYLDGKRPSMVFCRGYYTRTVLAAYDYRDGQLTSRWVFDTNDLGGSSSPYYGQGNHSISVGDVDDDGKDEIVYGSMAVDDDGTGLYSTQYGHGDAAHLGDFDPTHKGLEYWMAHEETSSPDIPQVDFRNAKNGEIFWQIDGSGDIGRGVIADIDPNHLGAEMWASNGTGVHDLTGNVISTSYPTSPGGGINYNMLAWWDGDLMRELVDRQTINKYNLSGGTDRKLTAYNYDGLSLSSNNDSKATPCIIADILGDWREEIIWRSSDNTYLAIFSSPNYTEERIYTLMHDPLYRTSIAWQNVGYNQPAHTGFYLGVGMETPPVPNIYLANESTVPINLDIDQDGVLNTEDLCPNTPRGTPVNSYGCTYIEETGISVYSQTPTCPNKADGKIIISSSLQEISFDISIKGEDIDKNFSNVMLSEENVLELKDLNSGTYEVILTKENIKYKQKFIVAIKQINEIKAERIGLKNNDIAIYNVSGSTEYNIMVNEVSSTYKTTTINPTELLINDLSFTGENYITIKGKNDCQGIVEDRFKIKSEITVQPNPTTDEISIYGIDNGIIQVYNMAGELLLQVPYSGNNSISLKKHLQGLYIVKVIQKENIKTFKVVLK